MYQTALFFFFILSHLAPPGGTRFDNHCSDLLLSGFAAT